MGKVRKTQSHQSRKMSPKNIQSFLALALAHVRQLKRFKDKWVQGSTLLEKAVKSTFETHGAETLGEIASSHVRVTEKCTAMNALANAEPSLRFQFLLSPTHETVRGILKRTNALVLRSPVEHTLCIVAAFLLHGLAQHRVMIAMPCQHLHSCVQIAVAQFMTFATSAQETNPKELVQFAIAPFRHIEVVVASILETECPETRRTALFVARNTRKKSGLLIF